MAPSTLHLISLTVAIFVCLSSGQQPEKDSISNQHTTAGARTITQTTSSAGVMTSTEIYSEMSTISSQGSKGVSTQGLSNPSAQYTTAEWNKSAMTSKSEETEEAINNTFSSGRLNSGVSNEIESSVSQMLSDSTSETKWPEETGTTTAVSDLSVPFDYDDFADVETAASSNTNQKSQSIQDSATPQDSERRMTLSCPWILFVLSGNMTVASRRQRDLGTYLRLNLAARLDADYNDVVINRILLAHGKILANVTVEPIHLDSIGIIGLQTLSQGNVTILELSGHEFTVDKIVRADQLEDERVENLEMEMIEPDIATYGTAGAVGSVFLFIFVTLFLGFFFHGPCYQGRDKYLSSQKMDCRMENLFLSDVKCSSPNPPVIYTENLVREMDSVNLLEFGTRFMPLDEPVTQFEPAHPVAFFYSPHIQQK